MPIQLSKQLAEQQRETRQQRVAVKRLLFAEQRGLADGREHFDGARLRVNEPHESDAGGEILLPPCRASHRGVSCQSEESARISRGWVDSRGFGLHTRV